MYSLVIGLYSTAIGHTNKAIYSKIDHTVEMPLKFCIFPYLVVKSSHGPILVIETPIGQ